MLDTVLATLVNVSHVGLPLLFVLIAVESMGVPLPGETALFAAVDPRGRRAGSRSSR